MKKNIWIGIITAGCLATACSSTYYEIETRIHSDGSTTRSAYAWADSAFLAGDSSHNPFLFPLEGWNVEAPDSSFTSEAFRQYKQPNIRATRTVSSIDQFSLGVNSDNPMAAPQESVEKRFRWFYTYYTYTGVFREIADKGPVPLDKFLTKEEQALWFQGDLTTVQGMNGVEMKDVLDGLEKQFQKWYCQSLFEVSYEVVQTTVQESPDKALNSRLTVIKDSIFAAHKDEEFNPEQLCTYLDEYLQTTHFEKLYQETGAKIEASFNEKCRTTQLFEYLIKYKMVLPGQILSSNTATMEGDALVWQVNAFRLLSGDYTLTAESRVSNTWAFVVTLLLLIVAIAAYRRTKDNK